MAARLNGRCPRWWFVLARVAAACLVAQLASFTAGAQTSPRPSPPPIVTADNAPWFREGKPLVFEGDFYYPIGAKRHFDSNLMVRTGSYRGVPLYADTTLEPFTVVFVPVGGAMMQPYERRSFGQVLGRIGRTHGGVTPAATDVGQAAAPPMHAPSIAPLIDDLPPPPPAGTAPPPLRLEPKPSRPAAPAQPGARNGVWIEFKGQRWKSAGQAVGYAEDRFVPFGRYDGVDVYVERRPRQSRNPRRIYVTSRPGVVAPFER